MVFNMDMVSLTGIMGKNIREIGKMARRMGMGSGLAKNLTTKASGEKELYMEKVFSSQKMVTSIQAIS